MNNMPELKIGVVAVSRDCFPEKIREYNVVRQIRCT